jgi:hypothetical protein
MVRIYIYIYDIFSNFFLYEKVGIGAKVCVLIILRANGLFRISIL